MSADRIRRRVTAALLCVLASCAAFRDHKLEPITGWPPPSPTQKPAINVLVTGNVAGSLKGAWRAQAVRALKDSGQFSSVTSTTRTDAPLTATLDVTYAKTENRGLMALSGFTLFLIPVPAGRGSFTVKTSFAERGKLRGVTTRSEGCEIWVHLLLIFAAPFATEDSAYYDCMRSSLMEAHGRQWLVSRDAP